MSVLLSPGNSTSIACFAAPESSVLPKVAKLHLLHNVYISSRRMYISKDADLLARLELLMPSKRLLTISLLAQLTRWLANGARGFGRREMIEPKIRRGAISVVQDITASSIVMMSRQADALNCDVRTDSGIPAAKTPRARAEACGRISWADSNDLREAG
jgi:hypothetical protein